MRFLRYLENPHRITSKSQSTMSSPPLAPPEPVPPEPVVLSAEADALVESLTSYVEETVESLASYVDGSSSRDTTHDDTTHDDTTHDVSAEIRQMQMLARQSASPMTTTKTRESSAPSSSSFFASCAPYCYNAYELSGTSPTNYSHNTTNNNTSNSNGTDERQDTSAHNKATADLTPRGATMEEPYWSDEINDAKDLQAMMKMSNDVVIKGAACDATLPTRPIKSLVTGTIVSKKALAEDRQSHRTVETASVATTISGSNDTEDNGGVVGLLSEAESPPTQPEPPEHMRWAIAASHVDFSGTYTIVVDDRFKKEYSNYLAALGFGWTLRNVALAVIGSTTEEIIQSHGGRKMLIRGKNPRGVWERLLTASGFPDFDTDASKTESVHYEHRKIMVLTADSEEVEAEAWWESNGTVHRSWLRGGTKYGGGDFESYRYLEEGGKVYVCRSIFHPNDKTRPRAEVLWKYEIE